MNQYEKEFYNDIREKKITATGAKHLASRGKHAVTVRTPSDFLTPKEREALSGEVVSYPMKPVSYKEWLSWDKAKRKAYIDYLQTEFNVSGRIIGEMFGVCSSAIYTAFRNIGINGGRHYQSAKQKEAWEDFLTKPDEEAPPEPVTEPELAETEPPNMNTLPSMFNTINSLSLQGCNKDELIDEIRRAVTFALPNGRQYKVTIEVR